MSLLMLPKRRNSVLVVVVFFILCISSPSVFANEDAVLFETEESEPVEATLFPWFVQALGVISFLILTRYMDWLPYTAVMFILGVAMGVGTTRLQNENQLSSSILNFWIPIDSELLLNVFLPGLVFKDSISLNVHLLQVSLGQCLIFAFPLVLAGAALTALVAFYIFPYNWSWNLSMTFGSILAATDPVAVSALLAQLGAPPRLQMHISGESLMNDGSAIVFFTIFSDMYFNEIDEELGDTYNFGSGLAKFCRMSLGAVAIGIFFGLGLLSLLRFLNRRLSGEENVVQVASTITIAYLTYYTADVAWKTSGVIATLTCGVVVRSFGYALINDMELLENFWELVEHLLNTVLFALGGLVWGSVIGNPEERATSFTGTDWGYLFLNFILLTIIRFLLIFGAYPITKRIGLGTCWQEQFFQAYGGLRGAVGISLAIALDNTVRAETDPGSVYQEQTTQLFGQIGGIAFLSLWFTAPTAGILLKKLGLADSTVVREHIVEGYKQYVRTKSIENMVRLLSQERFESVNFAVIRHHVPELKNLTKKELSDAVQSYRAANSYKRDYREPKLSNILPYIEAGKDDEAPEQPDVKTEEKDSQSSGPKSGLVPLLDKDAQLSIVELRQVFLDLVQSQYSHQMENGELGTENDFMVYSLQQSLEFASDAVAKGEKLNDWDFIDVVEMPLDRRFGSLKVTGMVRNCLESCLGPSAVHDLELEMNRLIVPRCLAFMHAHEKAQAEFADQFMSGGFSELAGTVIDESKEEYEKAEELLKSVPEEVTQMIVSHKFCKILLLNAAREVESLTEKGLLKETEAGKILDKIEERVDACIEDDHPGELEPETKSTPDTPRVEVSSEET